MTRIVVSGLGIASPIGNDTGSFWQSLLTGSGNFKEASALPGKGIRVAEVQGQSFMEGLGLSPSACDRNALFAVAAARQALTTAGLDAGLPRPERVGVILGNSAGGQCSTDEQ